MAKTEVTGADFETAVLKSEVPVLVDFWAVWCGPCKMLSPIIDEIADTVPGIKVCGVDVDRAPDLAMMYQVSAIPTLLVFKNGEVVNRSVGFVGKEQILSLLG